MSDADLIADAREWLAAQGDRVQTHSDQCHKWHPACLVSRLVRALARTGLQSANSGDVPERESNDHDAAPEARARTDADRGRNDNAATRPGEGTGDTFSPIAKRETDRPQAIASEEATPGEGT